MVTVTSNAQQVIVNTSRVQKRFATGSRKAANRAGRHIRDCIREQIPPGKGQAAGKFEGYAATGRLRRNVVATEPQQRPRAGDWTVQVVVRNDAVTDKYAHIHNVGGVIRAKPNNKAGGYLVFKIKGQWVKVKSVRIRRKLYFAEGVKEAQKDMASIIHSEIVKEIR